MKDQFKTPVIEIIEINNEEIIKTSGFYAFWGQGDEDKNYDYTEDDNK